MMGQMPKKSVWLYVSLLFVAMVALTIIVMKKLTAPH